jgi:hypothetical protein
VPATTRSPRQIDPNVWYTSAEAAEILGTSTRGVQRASRRQDAGRLRASEINERHDRRHLGQWLIDWLNARANRKGRATRKGKAA